jgi:hypothetical protein
MRRAGAPQCEQNFAPRNIIPKQEGHATVASREPQWLHFVASVEAEAPHIGHLRVSAGIRTFVYARQIFRKFAAAK